MRGADTGGSDSDTDYCWDIKGMEPKRVHLKMCFTITGSILVVIHADNWLYTSDDPLTYPNQPGSDLTP